MYIRVEKQKGNNSRAVANSVGQKKRNKGQSIGIMDNRPKVIVPKNTTVSQQKVIVASKLGDINKKDFTLLSHINWAKSVSGGPISDLNYYNDWAKEKDNVHIVEHGDIGSIDGATPDQIANAINTLPKKYNKEIRITSCWSGYSNGGNSLIKIIKDKIDPQKQIKIVGVTGPSITNKKAYNGNIEVVEPTKIRNAQFIQDALLGTLTNQREIKYATELNIWKKYKDMKNNWEIDVTKKPYSTMSIEELSEEAASTSASFYETFIKILKDNYCLTKNKITSI